MKKYILIVEPDAVLAQTYCRALVEAGLEVASVHDAQGAVVCMDQRRPDLIILELQLPVHSGVEFLYELRSYADWQHIPVIVNSYIHPRDLEPMNGSLQKGLGVRSFCYKPRTSLRQLVQAAEECLGGPRE
jgi:CheY-like chemotaxis protein